MRRNPHCRFCGTEFQRKRRGRRQLYCKPAHAQRAYERRLRRRLADESSPIRALVSDMRQVLPVRLELEKQIRETLVSILPAMVRSVVDERLKAFLSTRSREKRVPRPYLQVVKKPD